MDTQRAAEIQATLEGVRLPASRDELLRYAETQDRRLAAELATLLPDRTYDSLDDVGETLAPVQPRRWRAETAPRPESDRPPGGDDYLKPFPTSGAVRDDAPPGNPPQRVLEQQTKTQQAQKQRQGG